jgi:hypothetical protein
VRRPSNAIRMLVCSMACLNAPQAPAQRVH